MRMRPLGLAPTPVATTFRARGTRPARSAPLAPLALLTLLGLAGCSGDQVNTYTPITDPARLYLGLTLDHPAVTMAVGETLQLTATPRDARGAPIGDLPAPTFTSSDTFAVQVDATGRLTAREPRTGVTVVAELNAGNNVRHVDTALVTVTDVAPAVPFDTLTMDIVAPDSAIWPVDPPGGYVGDSLSFPPAVVFIVSTRVDAQQNLPPRVRLLDATRSPMAVPLNVAYRSLDPDIATVDRWSGTAHPMRAGRARMVAQATAYGVERADTLSFTVTAPAYAQLPIRATPGSAALFGPARTIRRNGVVMWLNALDRPVELVYDDPTHVAAPAQIFCDMTAMLYPGFFGLPAPSAPCLGGNLSFPAPAAATAVAIWGTLQIQQFPEVGTYTFRDTQTGATGQLIVTDDPSAGTGE